ncbi:MAG: 2Fe-2S iron-sulfur cluster-binding protein, partial [Gammaproteobacteria bacterium]
MSARRLASGGRIVRGDALRFRWNGRELRGCRGDTLASALLANDVFLLGRSFKYHRPRGLMSAGVEESGALLTIGEGARRDPNVKATVQELHEGLIASSQNARPGLHFDIGALAGLFARFLPAGFYYKTFMGPRRIGGTRVWMQFEKLIRRAAGMGEASRLPDPDRYEHAHAHCDALIVGGGPAGLAAAATAARAGLDVLLLEQDFEAGGDLLCQPGARAQLEKLLRDARQAGARIMTRTTAFGLYDGGVAGALERVTEHLAAPDAFLPRQRFWTLRARRIIVAAGAHERQFVFGDNDIPGVMGVNAARAYLHRYGILPGARIVVATNNDSAHRTAHELARAGAAVTVLDARNADALAGELSERAAQSGVELRSGSAPLRAHGGKRVKSLEVAVEQGGTWRARGRVRCDLALVSGGWSPAIHLLSQRARHGAKPSWDAQLACFLPPAADEWIAAAGSAA